jgi:TonB family protein
VRHHFAILLAILVLAACNRPPDLDRPDGSFDRAGYLALNTRQCADGMRRANNSVLPLLADRLCACIIDRMMAVSSDGELRLYHRSGEIPAGRMQVATRQCGGPTEPGQPLPAWGAIPEPGGGAYRPGEPSPSPYDIEEAPPPTAAPPSAAAASPGIEVADGPDAGAGASAPGGTRARVSALGNYLTQDDYPAAALRNDEQGRVVFTLDIDPTGRVAACAITATSGSAALDMTTCRIMRSRARYTPARNPRGVAVADRDLAAVRWVLPD